MNGYQHFHSSRIAFFESNSDACFKMKCITSDLEGISIGKGYIYHHEMVFAGVLIQISFVLIEPYLFPFEIVIFIISKTVELQIYSTNVLWRASQFIVIYIHVENIESKTHRSFRMQCATRQSLHMYKIGRAKRFDRV